MIVMLLFFALTFSTVFAVAFVSGRNYTQHQDNMPSAQFLRNSERGVAVLEYAMQPFRTLQNENDSIHIHEYSDNFAGKFIDDEGVLNIALVQNDTQNLPRNVFSSFNGAVRYTPQRYSFNHLTDIKNAVVCFVVEKHAENHEVNVFEISIKARYNAVHISLGSEIDATLVREALEEKSLYSSEALIFNIDNNAYFTPQRGPFFGGERIIGTSGGMGSITINATCNLTGRHGLVTAYHVIGSLNTWAGNWGQGTPLNWFGMGERGYLAGIDAMFIPYYQAGVFLPTAHIRQTNQGRDYLFTDVLTGGEEQIIEGTSVTSVGITTGVLHGTIMASSTFAFVNMGSIEGGTSGMRFDNVIRSSIPVRPGDSGGPLLANIGENRYLIGMNFAGGTTDVISVRATEIANVLDVTLMTNDFITYPPEQTSVPHFENLARNYDSIEFYRSEYNDMPNRQISNLNIINPIFNENRIQDVVFKGVYDDEGIYVGDEYAPFGGFDDPSYSAARYLTWTGSWRDVEIIPIRYLNKQIFWIRVENNLQQYSWARFMISTALGEWSNNNWTEGNEIENHFYNYEKGYRIGRAMRTVEPDFASSFDDFNFNRFNIEEEITPLTMWLRDEITPGTTKTINASSFMTANSDIDFVSFKEYEEGAFAFVPPGAGAIHLDIEKDFFENFTIYVPYGTQRHGFVYLRFNLVLRENFEDGYILSSKIVYIIFRLPDTRAMLANPTITVDNDSGVLTWGTVPNAGGYHIYVNGVRRTTEVITSNDFSLRTFSLNIGTHIVQVRAISSEAYFVDSHLSEIGNYLVFQTLLSPIGLRIVGGILSWEEVQSASGYYIYVDGTRRTFTHNSSINLSEADLGRGRNIQVRAMGDDAYILESALSVPLQHRVGCKSTSITEHALILSTLLILTALILLTITLHKKLKKKKQ